MTNSSLPTRCLRTRLLRSGAVGSLVLLATAVAGGSAGPASGAGPGAGTMTAHAMRQSALRAARADYWTALGVCFNISDPGERNEALVEAQEELEEALDLAEEQFAARLALVALLGEDPYDPELDPADFVAGVDNPYFPLVPGRTLAYEKETDEGLERLETTVEEETTEILGIECTVVHEVETLDGELVEDTYDWFAQDVDGNVWYMGEISLEYEDGELVSMEGSWKAGEDGAKPGIPMEAAPAPGDVYRQEFKLGEAEDVGTVIAVGQTVAIDYGTFLDCVQIEDSSPLEPGNVEYKYYAPGIGMVLEVDPATGEELELVEIIE
ncbi:MAG: hypothetical protein AB1726_16990 [Planctomycetota bacterium]